MLAYKQYLPYTYSKSLYFSSCPTRAGAIWWVFLLLMGLINVIPNGIILFYKSTGILDVILSLMCFILGFSLLFINFCSYSNLRGFIEQELTIVGSSTKAGLIYETVIVNRKDFSKFMQGHNFTTFNRDFRHGIATSFIFEKISTTYVCNDCKLYYNSKMSRLMCYYAGDIKLILNECKERRLHNLLI